MKKSIYVFGTTAYIDLLNENDSNIMNKIVVTLNRLDDEMSIYKDYSIISAVNKMAGKEYVKVSKDVINVIKKSIEYSKITNGNLDITCKPIIDIIKSGTFNIEEIIKKSKLINYKDILINEDNDSIKLKHENMGIDLGSMVKGYATDIIVDILNKHNVLNALIDLGGNIYVKGLNSEKSSWNVGIQDPFDIRYNSLGYIKLTNKSIVTSGNYERKDHIISAKTGLPVNDKVASVTIISYKSINGEGLSTACYIMGIEEGMRLVDSLPDIDCIYVTNDRKIFCTSKIKNKFILLNNKYKLM